MVIVAGFGCRAGATTDAFAAALVEALAETGIGRPDRLAIPADRAALLLPLARERGLPVWQVAAGQIAGTPTPTQSCTSLAARGTGSVAEAVALAAAGTGAHIAVTRRISPDRTVTCAIAIAGPVR